MVSNFLSPQMPRWETGTKSRPNNRPIKVILLARAALVLSQNLTLLASPLCPMVPSIQGKTSPTFLLSQLGPPDNMCGYQVQHLLQHLAGLQSTLHHDQWKVFGPKELGQNMQAAADPRTIPSALVEMARFWSFLGPLLLLDITAAHHRGC